MTTPSPDPFPRLAAALTDVSIQLRDIGDELRTLPIRPAATSAPPPPPAPWFGVAPMPSAAGDFRPQPARPTMWERISTEGAGSRIVAWIGGVVTLAGVVLLLVLAIQRGYVGPLPRLLLGAGLGAALVAIGLRLHASEGGRIGSLAVAATGMAVLYLDVVAATAFYNYLPVWVGLTTGLGVAAAGTTIAVRWNSQLFATFVVVSCAVSAPVLTRGFVALLIGFLLVLQIGTTPVQLRRRWSGLTLAGGIPTVAAVLLALAITSGPHGNGALTIAVLCLLTGIVQIVVATASVRLRPDDDGAFGLLLAGPIPTLLSAILVPRWDAVGLIGAIAVLLGLVWALHQIGVLRVPDRFATSATCVGALALFEATCLAFDGSVRAIALLSCGLLFGINAAQLRNAAALVVSTVFGGAGFLLALAGPVQPHLLAVPPSGAMSLPVVLTTGATGLSVAVTALITGWAASRVLVADDADGDAARLRWLVVGAVGLYGASGAVLSIGLAISPDRHGFLIGHVLVTVSWTLGALVLLLRHVDSTPLRVAGLALVAAALAKLVLFDLSSLSGIPRVLAFLGAGLVLLAAGARYAKLVAARDGQGQAV